MAESIFIPKYMVSQTNEYGIDWSSVKDDPTLASNNGRCPEGFVPVCNYKKSKSGKKPKGKKPKGKKGTRKSYKKRR